MKYSEESRLTLGVALRKSATGEVTGHRLAAYDYTAKKVLTVSKYKEAMQKEFDRVLTMPRGTPFWTTNRRPEGGIFEEDPITMLNKLAAGTEMKLWAHRFTGPTDVTPYPCVGSVTGRSGAALMTMREMATLTDVQVRPLCAAAHTHARTHAAVFRAPPLARPPPCPAGRGSIHATAYDDSFVIVARRCSGCARTCPV